MSKISKVVVVAGLVALTSVGVASAHNETEVQTKTELKANVNKTQKTVVGTITAINGNSVTFTTAKNVTYTADLTNAKMMHRMGGKMEMSQMAVGDKVEVRGTVTNNSIVATRIRDISVRRVVMAGKVTALNGNSITMKGYPNRSVNVSSSTKYSAKSGTVTLSNIVVGTTVKVEGLLDKTGKTVAAASVRILAQPKVTTNTSTSIQVK